MASIRRNALFVAAALAAFGLTTSTAAAQAAQQTASSDPQVAQRLSQVKAMAQYTVDAAKVGQQKATSPAAKDLANKIVKDYEKMVNDLQALASKHGIALDQNPHQAKMDQDQQGILAQLNAKSGADFDKFFVQHEIGGFTGLENAMKELRNSTPGKFSEIKKWLDDAENVTEASLNEARAAKSKVASTK